MTYHNISFSQFRECYRLFFACIVDGAIAEGRLLSEPADTESYIVDHQLDLFAPLFNPEAPKFKEFEKYAANMMRDAVGKQVFTGIDLGAFDDFHEKVISLSNPGMIGCHYRSIGLKNLRNSGYLATDHYWANLDKKDPRFKRDDVDEGKHLQRVLETYFDLFNKPKTVNQQIFNTNHPLGPIGLVFKIEDKLKEEDPGIVKEISEDPATLLVETLFEEQGFDLVSELQEGLRYKNKELGFLPYVVGEPREGEDWEDYRQQLIDSRNQLAEKICGDRNLLRRWEQEVSGFFRRRLPRNDLAETGSREEALASITDALEMFQGCLFYGSLTGMCIYTFPTTMQPEFPTCGFTLMTQRPLVASALDFLQHASEMIYSELFGATVLRQYRRSFRSSLHGSTNNRVTPLKLLADENANLVLTATLADTPIPIQAVNNFLALASRLPQVSIYERKSYSYFLVIVHQEFLESYLDRLKMNAVSKARGPEMIDEDGPGWQRAIHEYFYGDEISIELASHGMRINVGERSAPEHALFFVYPPFDEKIIDVASLRRKTAEIYGADQDEDDTLFADLFRDHQDAEERREAVILSDIVPIEHLKSSKRLQYIYARHFGGNLERDGDLDSIAEALTYGNHEIMVLIYETNRDMKMYHGGALVLESQFSRWSLPARRGDRFLSVLNDQCSRFLDDDAQGTLLCRGLIDFAKQSSRRRKGVFLVFHRGPKPERWESLDVASQEKSKQMIWELSRGFGADKRQLWGFLKGASVADGAIVFCHEENSEHLAIYTKTRIIHSNLKPEDHKNALMMKGLQAREEYPELRSFGTKHSAAYEYAMTSQSGFAIVVSEDGPVALFYPEELDEPKPPLKDWRWRVGIERM